MALTYNKKETGNCGLHGVQYQIELSTIFLLKAPSIIPHFKLSTENDDADKFDDLVIETSDGDILLQAKHKLNNKNKRKPKMITTDDLFSTNPDKNDFSIPKYLLSYLNVRNNFKIKHVIISTNSDINIDGTTKDFFEKVQLPEDHLLYYSGKPEYYKITDKIYPILKSKTEEYITLNKTQVPVLIEKSDLIEFSNKLQFLCNYTREKDLKHVISEIMENMGSISKGLDVASTIDIITRKMEAWLQAEKGVYLTNLNARAVFAELRSLKFEDKLRSFGLSFVPNRLPSHQILHLIPQMNVMLPMVKVFNDFKSDALNKILIVDPNQTVHIKLDIINVFEIPQYTHLIIGDMGDNKPILEEVYSKLASIINKSKYKRIILVGRSNFLTDKLAKEFVDKYEQLNMNIEFKDVCEHIQRTLIGIKCIDLQGRITNLNKLLDDDLNAAKQIVNETVLMKLASKEIIHVGYTVDAEPSFYIPRKLQRGTNSYNEAYILPKTKNSTEKVVFISDSPGAGKTTLLKSIASAIINNSTNIWVIRVNLNTYTSLFYEYKQKNKKDLELHDLLNSKSSSQLRSTFEKDLLYSVLNKVVLIFDGVDDIVPDYTSIVFNFIKKCKDMDNVLKVYISSRTYIQNDLEEALKLECFHLKPLSYESQVDFLVKFWSSNLNVHTENITRKIATYSGLLLDRLSSVNDPAYTRFLGIPLQIFMLAEIFQSPLKNRQLYWHSCEDYIRYGEKETNIPDKLSILNLFELFIEKKREIYVNVTCKSEGNVEMVKYFNTKFDDYLENHRNISLEVFFEARPKKISKDCKASLLRIGLIQKLNGRLVFIHKTFAEYFAAQHLLGELIKQSDMGFLLNALARIPRDQILTVFFEEMLDRESTTLLDGFGIDMRRFALRNLSSSMLIEKASALKMLQHKGLNTLHIAVMMNELDTLQMFVEKGAEINCTSYKNRTAWHYTAVHGNVDIMNFLISRDCDLMSTTDDGELASHTACYYGQLETLQFMIENNNIMLNMTNNKGNSHLHIASEAGHLEIVEFLCALGIDMELENTEGETSYHVAAKNGHVNIVEYFLKENVQLNRTTRDQKTALHLAVKSNHLDVVRLLINAGIDIETNNISLLETAANYGCLDVLTLLVEKNFSININTDDGIRLLVCAIGNNQRHIVEYILDYNDHYHTISGPYRISNLVPPYEDSVGILKMLQCILGKIEIFSHGIEKSLCKIIRMGHYDVMKYLLDYSKEGYEIDRYMCVAAYFGQLDILKYLEENGGDIMTFDENPFTLRKLTVLQHAASSGQLDVVKYLIDKGALHYVVENVETVFHLAASGGHFDVVTYLMSKEVDINALSKEGLSAIHYAAIEGSLNVLKFLIEAGIDINRTATEKRRIGSYDNFIECISESEFFNPLDVFLTTDSLIDTGMSALHYASNNGKLEVLQYLVRKGIDVYALSERGMTAVHFAAFAGHLDIVEYLGDRAVSLKRGNEDSITPLHLACVRGNLNVVQYLRSKKVPLTAKSRYGWSSLHFATCSGSLEVVKYLLEQGSDKNAKTDHGMTILHLSIIKNDFDLMRWLIDQNVDINALTETKTSALDLAENYGNTEMVEYLRQRGALSWHKMFSKPLTRRN